MDNLNKYLNIILATAAALFAILYFTHKCPMCPVCPEVVSSHTEGTKAITTDGKGDSTLIHRTPSKQKKKTATKPVEDIPAPVHAQQPEQEVSELFFDTTGFLSFDLQANDSICKELMTVLVDNNTVKSFSFHRTYLLPFTADSVMQKVSEKAYKNSFTLGLFAGKSSGVNVGYRFGGKHVTAGYDVINKGFVAGFNFDLGK